MELSSSIRSVEGRFLYSLVPECSHVSICNYSPRWYANDIVTAFSVWSLTMSLFHTNAMMAATDGWWGLSPDCTPPEYFLVQQLPFHSFSYSICSIMWLIRHCLSHTHWKSFPSPYEQRGLHSWFVMLRRPSFSCRRSLLTIPKECGRVVINGTQPVCGSMGPLCNRLEIRRC